MIEVILKAGTSERQSPKRLLYLWVQNSKSSKSRGISRVGREFDAITKYIQICDTATDSMTVRSAPRGKNEAARESEKIKKPLFLGKNLS